MKKKIVCILSIVCIILFTARCTSKDTTCVKVGDNTLKYASFLKMWEHEGCFYANIVNPWDTTKLLASYILAPHDIDINDVNENQIVIRTPVESLLVYTSVHAGVIKELGRIDVVRGVTDAMFYKIPEITQGLKSGKIIDAGKADAPITERIIELSPDAIILCIYQGMDSKTIDNLGIPILRCVDNMETTPLGRAEWIKFLGALTGKYAEADSIFSNVEQKYNSLSALTKSTNKPNPKVMVENMYQGVWYVSGGDSYQAKMIKDAGGDYVWKDDNSNGSLFLSFEQVYDKAHDADIWLLKVFGYELTKSKLEEMDKRNLKFRPVDLNGVFYANTAEVNLFEEFPFHPELMLSDYIHIFHPELIPNYTPRYFKQMKQ